ncbi:TPA: formyltetrahydrofolate deformylase, partial [Pseudomonas aeruginosa]
AIGRDTETVALSKAVKFHIERRVFLNGSRTVIFR